MIKQGTWAQITYFKNLQYFFRFLHILVALYRTFLNHLQLCLYDQTLMRLTVTGSQFFDFGPKRQRRQHY